jgi:predicted O-methyltransferase YrrM
VQTLVQYELKDMSQPGFPPGDYVSPGLERVRPDDAFPNMVIGDASTSMWPYLRREITHNWYVDRRAPTVGFLSRDEAAILYNTARVFDGLPCLEIGCRRGWSTVHIALGTHSLDSIDPILNDPASYRELVETLRRVGVEDRVVLHAGRSPEHVEEIAARTGKRWSFAFIDGDHGETPLVDAEVVQRFAADDALIILHDLAAPDPAAALAYLRDHGWTTAVYQTLQILGVATRGSCRPVAHIPDPSQKWSLPRHLSSFAVVGETHGAALRRIMVAMGRPAGDPIAESSTPAEIEELDLVAVGQALQAAEQMASELHATRHESLRLAKDAVVARSFDDLHARYVGLAETLAVQRFAQAGRAADLAETRGARDAALVENHRLRAEQGRLASLLDDLHARYVGLAETVSAQKIARARLEADLAETRSARDAALAESQRVRAEHGRLETLLSRSVRTLAARDRGTDRETTAGERRVVEAELLKKKSDRLRRKLRKAQVSVEWFQKRYVTAQVVDKFARSICRPRVLLGLARRRALGKDAETRQILANAFSALGAPLPMPPRAIEWLARPRTLFGLLRRRVLAGSAAAEGVLATALRARLVSGHSGVAVPTAQGVADSTRTMARLRRRLEEVTAQATIERGRVEETERKLKAVEKAMIAEERALYEAQIELTKLRRGVRVEGSALAHESSLGMPR